MCTMATRNNCVIVENVNVVDGPLISEDVFLNTSSSNMENVCLKIGHLLENKVLQLASMEIQVIFWKPHHRNSISWGFFVMNDDFPMDLENLQMLQCIVYKSNKTSSNVMSQNVFFGKKA